MVRSSRSLLWVLFFQFRTIGVGLLILPFILAIWQYQRGAERQATLTKFDQAARLKPEPLSRIDVAAAPDMRRVSVAGQALGQPAEFDNVIWQQGVGARVLQPVELTDHTVVLVDRGWRPRSAIGQPLPALPYDGNGRWVPIPQHFTLPGATVGSQGRVDTLDRAALAARLGRPLREGVVVLEHTVPGLRPWPARPPFDPMRHYAYAFQWGLLGVCLLLATIMRMRRKV